MRLEGGPAGARGPHTCRGSRALKERSGIEAARATPLKRCPARSLSPGAGPALPPRSCRPDSPLPLKTSFRAICAPRALPVLHQKRCVFGKPLPSPRIHPPVRSSVPDLEEARCWCGGDSNQAADLILWRLSSCSMSGAPGSPGTSDLPSCLSPHPVCQGHSPAPPLPQSEPQRAVERPLPSLLVHRQWQRPGEHVPNPLAVHLPRSCRSVAPALVSVWDLLLSWWLGDGTG